MKKKSFKFFFFLFSAKNVCFFKEKYYNFEFEFEENVFNNKMKQKTIILRIILKKLRFFCIRFK